MGTRRRLVRWLRAALVSAVAVTSGGAFADAPKPDPSSACVVGAIRDPAFSLWRDAGYGYVKSERAAWIVKNGETGTAWVRWPHSANGVASEKWKGIRPTFAIAIVHTHPDTVDPRPSLVDAETARIQGLPIYTVSRSGIWKVTPTGETALVEGNRWWQGCSSPNGCPTPDATSLREVGDTDRGC